MYGALITLGILLFTVAVALTIKSLMVAPEWVIWMVTASAVGMIGSLCFGVAGELE